MADARIERDPASYRDPSGFVYRRDGILLRQINASYQADWDAFESTGLSQRLRRERMLVDHEPMDPGLAADPKASPIAVIGPEPIEFLSYPYEWSFSGLKDAALLTLEAQTTAIEHGMVLKDATAYNVQFIGAKPILIDSLSFERYTEGEPWIAYRQFCEHFLGPLAVMAHRGPELGLMLASLPDGMPLTMASRLLPGRTRLNVGLLSHLRAHAAASRRASANEHARGPQAPRRQAPRMSRLQMRALIDSLRRTVEGLRWEPDTRWSDYASTTSYTPEAAQAKRAVVAAALDRARPEVTWDIGANTGDFSELAGARGRRVVAIDVDAGATELHYRRVSKAGSTTITPIIGDLRMPSPAIGWDLVERRSLFDRADADVVLALALVHHLAIGANVPLDRITSVLARLARTVIVEFVEKTDPQVVEMLANRRDVFPHYDRTGFRTAVEPHFIVEAEEPIPGAPHRWLFTLRRR